MSRLAIVASHPIQYQAPWYRALARVINIEVFFCHRQDPAGQAAAGFDHAFDWDVPLVDGYPHQWLENVARVPSVDTFGGCDTPGVELALRAGRFDACLVNGWYLKSYLQALRACRRIGLPVLMRGDSHLKTPRSAWTRAAKVLPYRWFLSRMDAHLVVGQANRAYLTHYGVPEARLFQVPHFVDNDWFARGAQQARADGEAQAIRSVALAGSQDIVMLFAGKLIEKKRPADFVEAVARLASRRSDIRGLVVGSGPLNAALQEQARARRAPIHFAGFRNQSEMPAAYAAADVIVLPSDGRETWGLVVNEAMACGVPAVVSDAVGCADDLIVGSGAGAIFPIGDVPALTTALGDQADKLMADRASVTRSVRTRLEGYTCDAAVAGTLEALAHVTRVPHRPSSALISRWSR